MKSRPTGASVSVDDSSAGVTPVKLVLSEGTHVASLTKIGFVPCVDTLIVKAGIDLVVNDSLLREPLTSINSIPQGAGVFLDSIFIGRTPLDSLHIKVGKHNISLTFPEYKQRDLLGVDIRPGIDRADTFLLYPTFGFVSVRVSPPDCHVSIDSGYPVEGNITALKLSPGLHSVFVTHPEYGDTHPRQFRIFPGGHLECEVDLDGFSPKAALYSVLVPGLGQYLDGDHVKGSAEFLVNAGAVFFLFNSLAHRWTRESELSRDYAAYQRASTESQAIAARSYLDIATLNLKHAKAVVSTSIGTLGIAYFLTLGDALIFNSTDHGVSLIQNSQLDARKIIEWNNRQSVGVEINYNIGFDL